MFIETHGSGSHVLLVHGTLESPEAYRPMAEALAAEHTVHLVHRSGHGKAQVPSHYDLAAERDALRDYLRDVGADAYGLVGSAEGSYLCFSLAIDPELPIRAMLGLAPYAGSDPHYVERARALALGLPGDRAHVAAELRAFAEAEPLLRRLHEPQIPIDLRIGALDDRLSLEAVRHIARSLHNTSLDIVPDRGHSLVTQDSARTLEAAVITARRVRPMQVEAR
ncbi:MAG: hypothetical protein U0230_12410 [Polyangiales bacterium]